MWGKQKMLVTSIFSFSHHVFKLPKPYLNLWATFTFLSANAFNMDLSKKTSKYFAQFVKSYPKQVYILYICLTLSTIYTHFNTLKKKIFWKTLWKKVKLLKMSNFTFFHNVFCAICILKSFNSNILVICSFFEFGTVSKWCNREWVKS